MNVLVVGGGGREHSLVWKIAQSPLVKKIICAPGNPGSARYAELVDVSAEDLGGIKKLAIAQKIDLVIIGPELPLVLGLADELEKEGIFVCGPGREAALLEGSKALAKEILTKYSIPTGSFEVFDDYDEAERYILSHALPVVIKVDGLADGKGACECETFDEAIAFLRKVMVDRAFGASGDRVVIEESLFGEEVSHMIFTDGKKFIPLSSSQCHKRIGDYDTGPNTGGMGAYSPAPVVTSEVEKKIQEMIFQPLLDSMRKEGKPCKGILYGRFMISNGKPSVLDFNMSFGDPFVQPLLVRIESDIVPVLVACAQGALGDHAPLIDDRASVCVVMASGGYPGSYRKGFEIRGLEEAEKIEHVTIFQAGTKTEGDIIVNAGGRVLGVTALGDTIKNARDLAYTAVDKISWEGSYYRNDIGYRVLEREV